jgi:hypothetical protein
MITTNTERGDGQRPAVAAAQVAMIRINLIVRTVSAQIATRSQRPERERGWLRADRAASTNALTG